MNRFSREVGIRLAGAIGTKLMIAWIIDVEATQMRESSRGEGGREDTEAVTGICTTHWTRISRDRDDALPVGLDNWKSEQKKTK
jgi:hypothetical protein